LRVAAIIVITIFGLLLISALAFFFYENQNPITNNSYPFYAIPAGPEANLPEVSTNGVWSLSPILMYHHIRINPSPDSQLEQSLSLSPVKFEEQIGYLKSLGFSTINLDELFTKREARKFIITFDDGYKDIIENALPILQKFQYSATVFVIVNDVGKTRYLTWDDLVALKNAGWSIGSHTLSHPNLTNASLDKASKEIFQSKSQLESRLGITASFFCYPSGQYNDEIIKLVEDAGYLGAVTTKVGRYNYQSKNYELTRVRVRGTDTLDKFKENLGF